MDAGALEPTEALALLCPVVSQVVAAHGAGKIHGGLCPEAVSLSTGRSGEIVATLEGFGKPGPSAGAYAAPEVGSMRPDARADQYALAAVMYELLTGDPPARRARRAESLRSARTDPVRLARELPGVPANAAIAMLRALESDPEDRYPTVRAFGAALFGDAAMPSYTSRERAATVASWIALGARWASYAAGMALIGASMTYALAYHGVSMSELAESQVELRAAAYARALERALPVLVGSGSGASVRPLIDAFERQADGTQAARLPATVALHEALRTALSRTRHEDPRIEIELESLANARDVTERSFDDWTRASTTLTARLAQRLELPVALPPAR